MFAELSNEDASVITLGQLRAFINNDCAELSDDTPCMLNCIIEDKVVVDCTQVLADEESVEFYNY